MRILFTTKDTAGNLINESTKAETLDPVSHVQEVIQHYNETLRSHERARELVSVVPMFENKLKPMTEALKDGTPYLALRPKKDTGRRRTPWVIVWWSDKNGCWNAAGSEIFRDRCFVGFMELPHD